MRVYELEDTQSPGSEKENGRELARFIVLYAKASSRKHKKWEGDGVLICYTRVAILKSEDEREIISRSTSIKNIDFLEDGKVIMVGGLEVQIQEKVDSPSETVVKNTNDNPICTPISKPMKRTASTESKLGPLIKRPLPFTNGSKKGFVCPVVGWDAGQEKTQAYVLNASEVSKGATAVTVDPLISRFLRKHQQEGVQFIYDRLKNDGGGCILADDMGLGKSIQTIASTWSVLKSQGKKGMGVQKCLIVVPSSLVNNWKAEFRKWFKTTCVPVKIITKVHDINVYSSSYKCNPYMIMSYEMAARYAEKLIPIRFDIMVCDEAHRLKNMKGKLRESLLSLCVTRRLLLTGTPLQNDLEEFFSILDFACPSKFGTSSEFKKMCNESDPRLNELIEDTILRRSSDINKDHLPDKHEYVMFCAPSNIQKKVFMALCDHMTGDPLVLMDLMRKLANHPALLYKKITSTEKDMSKYAVITSAFPKEFGSRPASITDSGKLSVLLEMLGCFRKLNECCVVVSNYTKTLDMIEGLCQSIGLTVLRLDGSVALAERQKLVNVFNTERNPNYVFLLSSKAGGVGLNLIAASRLILFDSDWNPACDLQAMARIWRDGQTRACHIYRLATTGTIDEKILQRQIKKTGLTAVLDLSEQRNVTFSDEDLYDIFNIVETKCNTHDLLDCFCGGNGLLPGELEDDIDEEEDENEEPSESETSDDIFDENNCSDAGEVVDNAEKADDSEASMAELFRWRHFSPENAETWNMFCNQAGDERYREGTIAVCVLVNGCNMVVMFASTLTIAVPWCSGMSALGPIAGVLGGCMGCMVVVENIAKQQPSAMNLMTFATFLFTAVHGLIFTSKFLTVRNKIPLKGYIPTVITFFTVNVINNQALNFHVPVPLHIIFRSGSLLANMVLALCLGKRYNTRKYLAVLAITVGIIICTLASNGVEKDSGISMEEASKHYQEWMIGIGMLTFALIASAYLAIAQEQMYKDYGKHPTEAMFVIHAVSLPFFLLMGSDIASSAATFTASAPFSLLGINFPISALWVNLVLSCFLQYFCIRFVYELNSRVDALTVTLVVTLRKFLSLIVSIWWFQNPFTEQHWVGAILVFVGTLAFADIWGTKAASKDDKKKKQ
ncbi:unnamed protein product [Auanema sp. JU1783]|nr:unnamed protein product [Auanema sp. JU1783]